MANINQDSNPPPVLHPKKKRNLPGNPDPEAEVVSLSPKSLLATNRFPCEICGKGFQRDQNLQLHRRGHNLPWKLKQRGSKEARKRVYVCPEKNCVHHHPSRALGDLTGIKKHFCRKHGEKKWKCDKCAKRYAVQSDWKAHSKTCRTREYRCDCGTIFSRRDSFITHRAFCDALAEETARITAASNLHNLSSPPFNTPSDLNNYQFTGDLMRSNIMHQYHLSNPNPNPSPLFNKPPIGNGLSLWLNHEPQTCNNTEQWSNNQIESMNISTLYGDQFASLANAQQLECQLNLLYGNSNKLPSPSSGELTSSVKDVDSSNSLLVSVPSLFSNQHHRQLQPVIDTSATALLQKAAQIGVTSSSVLPSFLRNFELKSYSSSSSELGSSISEFAVPSNNDNNNPYVVYSTGHQYLAQPEEYDLGGETRDFLGVGGQTLCSSTMSGWI